MSTGSAPHYHVYKSTSVRPAISKYPSNIPKMFSPKSKISLVCLLVIISSAVFTYGSKEEKTHREDVLDKDELYDENESSSNIFVPTKEWKVVKEGQHIPRGLHVRMDLQTGLKEAKILDDGDSRSSPSIQSLASVQESEGSASFDNRRVDSYGKSDRRGVINKRTKVFSTEEVAKMLEDNDDDKTGSDPPRIASEVEDAGVKSHYSELNEPNDKINYKKERDLPISFHQDIEDMLKLSEVLASKSSSVAELTHALEELEYYVHQIDNARDLNVFGGLVLVVRLLNHTHPDVKSWAAHVIGSASQR